MILRKCQLKQPKRPLSLYEGNCLVLTRAPHKIGVVDRVGTKI
jgi:hypothetical protein